MTLLILYASRSGNTERASHWVADVLSSYALKVHIHNAQDYQPHLLTQFPVLVLGCSTIGEGDLLPAFFPWEKTMRELSLTNVYGAAFGTGAPRYRYFAEAVTILENRLKNMGVKLLLPGLKIDTSYGLRREQVEPWAHQLGQRVLSLFS